jgi:hypothetical protein
MVIFECNVVMILQVVLLFAKQLSPHRLHNLLLEENKAQKFNLIDLISGQEYLPICIIPALAMATYILNASSVLFLL